MPLAVMSFFGSNDAPIADIEMQRALELTQRCAPEGSRCELRALDATFLELNYVSPDAAPEMAREGEALPKPFAGAVATVWFDDALDNVELRAQQSARKLHARLNARGTATFDARRHLDLVNDDNKTPPLQAVITIERRADLDRDAFIQYYRTHHAPLAKSLGPRFTRYTTFRTLEIEGEFPFDCITFQEYPSLDEIRAHMGNRLKNEDEAKSDVGNFNRHIIYNIGERTLIG